jgi:hypothetical protein
MNLSFSFLLVEAKKRKKNIIYNIKLIFIDFYLPSSNKDSFIFIVNFFIFSYVLVFQLFWGVVCDVGDFRPTLLPSLSQI